MNEIIQGDSLTILSSLPAESVDCCITSPPYWGLRDYGAEGQLGLEKTPEEYVANMVKVFAEVKRVLKKEGTLWLNLGDTYSAQRWTGKGEGQAMNKMKDGHRDINPEKLSGLPDKNLVGIPWRVAFALQADGWYLRQDIIWAKPNPMPESVTDRCTKSHEYIFLMSKNPKYYFDNEAIKEKSVSEGSIHVDGNDDKMSGVSKGFETRPSKTYTTPATRNRRSVWTITTKPFKEAHFATFPEDLIVPMVKAGCPPEGIVLDPFMGAGTTGLVARKLQRNYLGIELNPAYVEMARKRIGEMEKQPVLV